MQSYARFSRPENIFLFFPPIRCDSLLHLRQTARIAFEFVVKPFFSIHFAAIFGRDTSRPYLSHSHTESKSPIQNLEVNPLPFIAGGDCFGRMGTTRGSYGLTSLTT